MVKSPKAKSWASKSNANSTTGHWLCCFFGAFLATGVLSTPLAAEQDSFIFGASAVSDPYLGQREVLGFSEGFESWVNLDGTRGVVDYSIWLSFAGTGDQGDFRFDRSQIVVGGDNWSVALGATERNWSFSPNTSLIWSQNARPVPALSIERARASSDTRWLSWMGDWSGEIVFGQLDGDQPDPNVSMFGARLVVNPAPGLDVEFVRTAQWGGEGRPGGLEAFWDMLIGNSNQGSAGGDDPANQLAGIGLSYTFPKNTAPLRLYLQAIGEDEASGFPSCFMYLAGAEWTGAIGSAPTTIVVEGLSTVIDFTDGGFCGPQTAYGGQYSRGYTHFGAVMGAAVDTAGRSISIDVSHEFEEHAIGWGAKQIVINDTGVASHRLSSERVEGATGYLSYRRNIGRGRLETGLTYQGFSLDTANLSEGLRASLSYEFTF